MRPILLKLTNFLSYEDETFDFSAVTNATITGRNGAGKSSFCTDAITWALFGKGSRGSEKESGNYVATGATSCCVELTFDLNQSKYKVIRAVNAAKNNRMALNLFVIDKDGNEIPMTGSKLSDTQNKIESLLKMSYKTFTASSMIFQGKSDEFTNGMSNAERKEALINILNINEWEQVGEQAKADLSNLKQQLKEKDARRDAQCEAMSRKKEYEDRRQSALDKLEKIGSERETLEAVIKKNQEAIFQRDSIGKIIADKQAVIKDTDARTNRNTNEMKSQQGAIERNNKTIRANKDKIAEQQALIGRKEEIEAAVESAKTLQEEVNGLWDKQQQYMEARSRLDKACNDGKVWATNHDKDLQLLTRRIEDAKKQAKALETVPCAKDEKLSSSCAFLKMAREAKAGLEKLTAEKNAKEKEKNPYTAIWKKEQTAIKSLTVDPKVVQAKRKELAEVQKVANLKPVLDNAATTIAMLVKTNVDFDEQNKEIKSRIEEIRGLIAEDKESKKQLEKELAELNKSMSAFEEVYAEQEQAKAKLEDIKKQETSLHSEIGSCDALLKQVAEAEVALKAIKKEINEISADIADTEMLIEACGKNSGVPALIVENAVPELEAEANQILENMMDGRLQLRLDTQIETNKGTKQEVFRITVLDDGYERRYETYSGAEKFVVDLAIRIAMSKFLCKRSGASVSLFVLDEGVSCADESNRDEIIKAIRSITTEFETVLFVTHIEELKDALDQRIEVTKNSLGSHIRLQAAL